MLTVLAALVVAAGGTWGAWRYVRAGSYRYPGETGPVPDHRWVLGATPLMTAALAWAHAGEPPAPALAVLLAAPAGVALVAVDVDVRRLPNVITLRAAPVVLALLTLGAWSSGEWSDLRRAVVAMVVVGGGFVLASLALGSRGIGMGDAKLMLGLAPLLAWHGWSTLLVGVYGAFLLGGVVALTLVVTGRARRSSHLAFGPYLVGAGLLALLLAG